MARPKAAVDYDGEISSCEDMIAKYRAKKQRLVEAKLHDENERIISLVRGRNLSLDELNSAVDEFMAKRKTREDPIAVKEQQTAENINTDEKSVIKEEQKSEENL